MTAGQTTCVVFTSACLVVTTASCSDRSAKNTSAKAPVTVTPAVQLRPAPPPAQPKPATTKASSHPIRATETALAPPYTSTTRSGIYTAAEAREGRDLYLGFCASCHAASTHTGPVFRQHWAGRPLADLFNFMRTNMPKNDPGSLDEYQYGVLLAYILQLNEMPAGKTPLASDSTDLTKIRIDTARSVRRTGPMQP